MGDTLLMDRWGKEKTENRKKRRTYTYILDASLRYRTKTKLAIGVRGQLQNVQCNYAFCNTCR